MEQLDSSAAADGDAALRERGHRDPGQLLHRNASAAEELYQQVQALLVQGPGGGEQAQILGPRQLGLHIVCLQEPHVLQVPAA